MKKTKAAIALTYAILLVTMLWATLGIVIPKDLPREHKEVVENSPLYNYEKAALKNLLNNYNTRDISYEEKRDDFYKKLRFKEIDNLEVPSLDVSYYSVETHDMYVGVPVKIKGLFRDQKVHFFISTPNKTRIKKLENLSDKYFLRLSDATFEFNGKILEVTYQDVEILEINSVPEYKQAKQEFNYKTNDIRSKKILLVLALVLLFVNSKFQDFILTRERRR